MSPLPKYDHWVIVDIAKTLYVLPIDDEVF